MGYIQMVKFATNIISSIFWYFLSSYEMLVPLSVLFSKKWFDTQNLKKFFHFSFFSLFF